MIENVLDEIIDLVTKLKLIESSETFEEVYEKLGNDKIVDDIKRILEEHKQSQYYMEDMEFYAMRSFYCTKFEEEIMTLLKGNI